MLVKIKAFPNSKKQEVIQKSGDSFEIKVREKPVKGLANKRIAALLAERFAVPLSKVRLVKGFSQRNKIFEISD